MNGTINELKQGLLKCANENENKTYLTGQVIVSSICKDAKNTIERLEKEKEENDSLKEKIKNVREKLFNLLSEYEIGNYDNNTHQFYKDVYYIHNELMEGVECKNIIDV